MRKAAKSMTLLHDNLAANERRPATHHTVAANHRVNITLGTNGVVAGPIKARTSATNVKEYLPVHPRYEET
jgi:hypothetical protein